MFLGLLLSLAFLSIHATLRMRESNILQRFVRTTHTQAGSPNRVFLDNDSYLWLTYAQEVATGGIARVRATAIDNAPQGRPVHWSSGYTWWLVLLGKTRQALTGESVQEALQGGAVLAGPILLGVLLFVLATFVLIRNLGWSGLVLLVLVVTSPQLFWTFFASRPDHHALISALALCSLLAIVLGGSGWVTIKKKAESKEPPTTRHAAYWFILSAAACAGLMWISAVSAMALLGAIGVSALGSRWAERHREPSADFAYAPNLWRLWGILGGALSLGLYLLEYAPSNMSMRLEVIHPLHCIAWAAGGELLCQLTRLRRPRVKDIAIGLPLVTIALFPVALPWALGSSVHILRDPFMWRLHHFIDEFLPYLSAVGGRPHVAFILDFGPYIFVAPLALYAILRVHLDGPKKGAISFCLLVTAFMILLTLWQYRWASFLSIASLVTLVVTVFLTWDDLQKTKPGALLQGLLVVALSAHVLYFTAGEIKEARIFSFTDARGRQFARQVILRDVARTLAEQQDHDNPIILCGPPDTPALCYHGSFHGIGSLYWENADGLKTAAAILTSTNDTQAFELIHERGVDYVVLFLKSNYVGEFLQILEGQLDLETAKKTLGFRLLDARSSPPSWLREIPYNMPFPELHGFPDNVRVYAVKEDEP